MDAPGWTVLDGFTIENGVVGIAVTSGGNREITNNVIKSNATFGVVVSEGAAARIGHLLYNYADTQANLITLNGDAGIRVERSSSAMILGNTISANGANGIAVARVSQADIAGNTIEDNALNGISVRENSGVNLGNDKPDSILDLANYTDAAAKNHKAGIECVQGGYISGYQGSLNGLKGALAADATCIRGFRTAMGPGMLVGFWSVTVVASGGDTDQPQTLLFNQDGSGTAHLSASGDQPFDWALNGNQLTVHAGGRTKVGALTWQGGNDCTWRFTSSEKPGVTLVFKLHRQV
jgi:parallel beta-helix repeat protein